MRSIFTFLISAVFITVFSIAAFGQIESAKYAQITTAFVNAVKEQQAQIKEQQQQIEALKSIICSANPTGAVCKQVEISNGGAQR